MSIDVGADGFYHPTDDAEIIELVMRARAQRRTLRVRGSGHAPARATYTDPLGDVANKANRERPPAGPNMNVVLDCYAECSRVPGEPGWRPVTDEVGLIEVDGGMVLGSGRDAQGPKGVLQQLHDEGWALRSTGGLAHQTVAGFIATASAGGSHQWSVSGLVCGVQLIDGTGAVREIDADHPDFPAVVPHLGLLGIVTKVRLRCEQAFTVEGTQVTSTLEDASVDLFGQGRRSGTSLSEFLREREYARIDWWPQRGCERVRVWEGHRVGPPPSDFDEKRLQMFEEGEQLKAGLVLTALGNRHDVRRMRRELKTMLDHAEELRCAADGDAGRTAVRDVVADLRAMGSAGTWVAAQVEDVTGSGTRRGLTAGGTQPFVERWVPGLFRSALNWFMPGDEEREAFHDHAWRALPMDDAVDDVFMPVEFTEFWVPWTEAARAMSALKDYFDEPLTELDSFARTGLFEFELYAGAPSRFWLNPAFSNGKDDWSEGALRINPYWYARNPGDPAQTFFPQFWKLLHDKGIPYRLHWGKFLPRVEQIPDWPARIRDQYPCWAEFMRVRRRYDPDDLFVNDYWRAQLGLNPQRSRIADLHCHYPMRVLADRSREAVRQRKRCRRRRWFWLDWLRCAVMKLAARRMNFEGWSASWRVTFHGLQDARAGLVLSVLYDPLYELLVIPGRQRPRPAAFDALICQLQCVEADLERADDGHGGYRVVKSRSDLDRTLAEGRMAIVHCVEGGLHLGDSAEVVAANVALLAEKGVAYITLAHLFHRGVATNASALPQLSDERFDSIFRQRGTGLSDIGRAAVMTMYEQRMLIDVAHMDGAALGATFELLDELDADTGARPHERPVIASHAGYRFGELHYMLDEQTIRAIARRDGVIGLILARHQLEEGLDMKDGHPSRFHALDCHIKAIHRITGSYEHVCIGSDLDGFIKPTVSGIERAADLRAIEPWLRRNYSPAVAEAILFRNAERVVTSALR